MGEFLKAWLSKESTNEYGIITYPHHATLNTEYTGLFRMEDNFTADSTMAWVTTVI